jgi:hypothetical protein
MLGKVKPVIVLDSIRYSHQHSLAALLASLPLRHSLIEPRREIRHLLGALGRSCGLALGGVLVGYARERVQLQPHRSLTTGQVMHAPEPSVPY